MSEFKGSYEHDRLSDASGDVSGMEAVPNTFPTPADAAMDGGAAGDADTVRSSPDGACEISPDSAVESAVVGYSNGTPASAVMSHPNGMPASAAGDMSESATAGVPEDTPESAVGDVDDNAPGEPVFIAHGFSDREVSGGAGQPISPCEASDTATDEPASAGGEEPASAAEASASAENEAPASATEGPASAKNEAPASAEGEEPASATEAPAPADSEDPPAFDFGEAEKQLLALQQELRALKVPVVIVLEGWSAAGKGTLAGELLEGLDPRGYHVYVPERFSADEALYPRTRRYWTRMPKAGDVSLFIGSWYRDVCESALEGKRGQRNLSAALERVNLMERMLSCDGTLILKFFINISRKEQKRRLREMEEKKLTRSLVSRVDVEQNERYDKWQKLYNQVLAATSEEGAVWHVLRGANKRECKRQLYTVVMDAFRQAIAQRNAGARPWDVPALPGHEPLPTAVIPPLYAFDPHQTLEEDYQEALDEAQKKLRRLQYELYRRGIPMVLAFEGWDAAGKGGCIRRLCSALDPRGFTVVPISAPTPEEKAHHHLWRFWNALPARGDIAIFDRTWYGRVMVERIEGFCTEAQWQRSYEEINLFERELKRGGVIVRKFWLQIDSEEQLKRFIARRDDPEKQWKITDEDWRNREKWAQYETAVGEMLQKTNTHAAPWIVVEADNKQYARIKVLRSVIAAIEERLEQEA